MATLGSVVVEMSASTAKFESDLGRAAQVAERHMAQIDKAIGFVRSSLSTLGVAVSLGLVIDQVKSKIEGAIRFADDLQNLSERTGATVEALSELAGAARLSGNDLESLAGGLQRLSRSVVDAQNGGKQTAAAFKALGISIQSLRGMGPDEVFKQIAQQMEKYRDGVEKTTVAQVLMGRSGANLLPLMKDLAVVNEYQVKVTTAQAMATDEMFKNMVRLEQSSQALYQMVGMSLVPVFNDLLKTLLHVQNVENSLRKTTQELAADGTFRAWAQDTIMFLAIVAESIAGVIKVVYALGGSVQVMVEDVKTAIAATKYAWDELKTLGQGDDSALKAQLEKRAELLTDVNGRYKKLLQDGTTLSTTLRKQFDESNKALASAGLKPAGPSKPIMPTLPMLDLSATGNNNKFRDDPYKKILEGQIKAIEDSIAAENKLLASRVKMLDFYYGLQFSTLREAETKKQQLLIDNLATVKAAYDEEIRLAREAAARKGATQVQIAEANNKAEEAIRKRAAAEIEANQAVNDSSLKLLAVQAKFNLATDERTRLSALDNANAQFAIDMMGQTTLAVLKLTAAREIQLELEERIRQLRLQDPAADTSQALANAAIQTANATALIELSYNKQRSAIFGASEAVRKYQEDAGNAAQQIEGAMTRAFLGMEDALVKFVTTGKLSFTDLANSIVADITRIIIKQQLAAALDVKAGGGGLGNFFSRIVGSLFNAPARAIGGPVLAGGMYEVNEGMPELLNLKGREYLMMGNSSGQVKPLSDASQGSGGRAPIIVNVQATPNMSRSTAMQQGAAIGQGIRNSMMRNT